ncbi:septation protein SepH [Kocuria oceani]|uniref:septation protein SepH n=1 Tax=Kocuria oceani TaxID=988827 RepID=UPI002407410B|nr:septation protein SepH [Kocuria oceani]
MEQLRLAGVHDDGEHLVVEDETGTRRLLRIDQELRLAVQRARRLAGARPRGTGQFGPREIQARFRAGATVEEIVAESGWEAARVRRYEWPILAERAHIAAEAQKVEIEDRSAHRGYHSVFEGEPLTLGRAVAHRAGDLGVDPSSLEWDSWQREDHLWTVVARFSVADAGSAPTQDEPQAEWLYNPANQSVRPASSWAEALTETGTPDTPLGAGLGVLDGGLDPELTQLRRSAVEADDLLDVLQARRGQRIGEDVEGDDALAELLGRGMGHVERRPRPLAAPEDAPVFDRPFQPATRFPDAAPAAPDTTPQAAAPQNAPEDGPGTAPSHPEGSTAPRAAGQGAAGQEPVVQDASPQNAPEQDAPERDVTDQDVTDQDVPEQVAAAQDPSEPGRPAQEVPGPIAALRPAAPAPESPAGRPASGRGEDAVGAGSERPDARDESGPAGADTGPADGEGAAPERPRPRNRTAKARRSARSSVPSWDEIVFGSSSD